MNEEDKEIIKSLIKGDKECLEVELRVNSNNKEDIEHWKKEIKALEKLSNFYEKEKARADKLENEYSKMLTKIDEYEVNYILVSLVEEKIKELKQEYKIELEKNSIKAFILKCKIEALEELLQEGE